MSENKKFEELQTLLEIHPSLIDSYLNKFIIQNKPEIDQIFMGYLFQEFPKNFKIFQTLLSRIEDGKFDLKDKEEINFRKLIRLMLKYFIEGTLSGYMNIFVEFLNKNPGKSHLLLIFMDESSSFNYKFIIEFFMNINPRNDDNWTKFFDFFFPILIENITGSNDSLIYDALSKYIRSIDERKSEIFQMVYTHVEKIFLNNKKISKEFLDFFTDLIYFAPKEQCISCIKNLLEPIHLSNFDFSNNYFYVCVAIIDDYPSECEKYAFT
jgi:hypothetical protein